MELPRHIADMCGVIIDGDRPAKAGNSITDPVLACERGEDGVTAVSYNGTVIGWVQKCGRENYQTLALRGEIGRFSSHRSALNHLIGDMF